MTDIMLYDCTLRDGNHAVQHQLAAEQIALYSKAAEEAGVHVVEVGHGNGIGASSLQIGLAKESDMSMLEAARSHLHKSKLGVHVIPGLATINKDLQMAVNLGVDVFRVASHCTEADITQRHISFLKENNKETYGVLMMSHMASPQVLAQEALKMESYGAEGVIIMDSAGHYLPNDVAERIQLLRQTIKGRIGFHGHNNMGMAVANSITAVNAGACIIDGCARGFGAGAGNTQLEVLIAVLEQEQHDLGIDLYKMLDAADIAENKIIPTIPTINSTSIISGMSGVFSGFLRPVERISKKYGVDPRDVFTQLKNRKVVAGQEDIIVEVAIQLMNTE